jgi:hypothetical protein
MKRMKKIESTIQEMGERNSPLGDCLYIRVHRMDGKPMGWEEVWERFAKAYPGQWAIQVFPPEDSLVNDFNLYHLFVLETLPSCFKINATWHGEGDVR